MGRSAEHFGHDPREAGKKAADDLVAGRITKEQFKELYADAKFRGDGEAFKEGYAEGADKHMTSG